MDRLVFIPRRDSSQTVIKKRNDRMQVHSKLFQSLKGMRLALVKGKSLLSPATFVLLSYNPTNTFQPSTGEKAIEWLISCELSIAYVTLKTKLIQHDTG